MKLRKKAILFNDTVMLYKQIKFHTESQVNFFFPNFYVYLREIMPFVLGSELNSGPLIEQHVFFPASKKSILFKGILSFFTE